MLNHTPHRRTGEIPVNVQPTAAFERATDRIEVDDPATGAVIGSVPDATAEAVAGAGPRPRGAHPAGAAIGFRGRAGCSPAPRRWMLDHQAEILASIVAENGKSEEDAVVE